MCKICGEKPVATQSRTKWRTVCYGCHRTRSTPLIPREYVAEDVIAKFWAQVPSGDSDECWEWQGVIDSRGYPRFKYGGDVLAHRVAWRLWNGRRAEHYILHSCDNPKCVNPHHLSDDTQAQNMREMIERGRSTKGRTYRRRLTIKEVQIIRAMGDCGWTYSFIAKQMPIVHEALVGLIVRRQVWSKVPEYGVNL